jgi:hypothetical protein
MTQASPGGPGGDRTTTMATRGSAGASAMLLNTARAVLAAGPGVLMEMVSMAALLTGWECKDSRNLAGRGPDKGCSDDCHTSS